MTTFLGSAYFLWSEKTPVLAQIALRALNLLIKNHRVQYYKQHRSERKCTDCRRKPKFFYISVIPKNVFFNCRNWWYFHIHGVFIQCQYPYFVKKKCYVIAGGVLNCNIRLKKIGIQGIFKVPSNQVFVFVKIFLISIVWEIIYFQTLELIVSKKNTLGKLSESTYSYCFQ